MNGIPPKGEVTLRPAIEKDALDIYELNHEAFGATYLAFTIYRSRKTVAHIASLIASGVQAFVTANRQGKLAGYANTGFAKDLPILNYIAVAKADRGSGLGNLLLQTTESEVRDRGFETLELDVFESNKIAVQWYAKVGYGIASRSFLYRIDLARLSHKSQPPQADPTLWRSALAAERQNGFSKVVVRISGGEITLGLIEGVACKLLDYQGVSLDEAISSASSMVNGSRSELIVSSSELPTTDFQLLGSEIALRMVKKI